MYIYFIQSVNLKYIVNFF